MCPKKERCLSLKIIIKEEKAPFVIYADFESCIKSIHTCDLNPESSYTKQYQKHEPISFYCYIKCFDSKVYLPIKERSYTGKNAEHVFLKYLEQDIKMIANIPKKKIIFGKKEEERYNEETGCWICKGEFDDKDKNKERLKIIVIIPVDIEEPRTTNVILIIENLILRPWYFIILVGMIAIYL